MGVKKFINSVKELLGLEGFEVEGKKKSIRRLLEKLKSKKEMLEKESKKKMGKKESKELKEELTIISLQIKKGEKILARLNDKKNADISNKK
ncbi:hypothetical protein [Sulfurovum sp. NBC37-1]|uniref:hypothetical protein n=1 Tax=Sulfurovum sp. (strain NBC37-1) TaxID=387093 RepID=UPI000158748E|nr:hypothetical protein [Sulfurovum sp. NBC37-1]BAF72078.1 hypothetical protein SUN_1123 [Sulfurovum sp. NBC37-1]